MKLFNTPLFAESWNVCYRFRSQGKILDDHDEPFIVIPNSLRSWAADPIVFEHNGNMYIFAELYDYTLCRGVIGVSEYLGNGLFGKWKQIIKEPFHMSYPFVFSADNTIYMLPETSGAGALILYRAVDFPMKWERCKEIKPGIQWVDTTIVPTEDGYEGFTASVAVPMEILRVQLDHKLNLVQTEQCPGRDYAHYRPGGRPFNHKGNQVWVYQDCEQDYGIALFFRFEDHGLRSIRITPQELTFTGNLPIQGMHTYTATEQIEVIDIKTRRFNLLNLFFRFVHKLRR